MQRYLPLLLAASLMLIVGQSQAAIITGLYNTGYDSAGTLLAHGGSDAHYSLTSKPVTSSGSVIAITAAGGFPITPTAWLGDNSTSRWIKPLNGPNADFADDDPSGVYEFSTTFDLTGFDKNTAVIQFHWATDNLGSNVLVNGHSTGFTSTSYSAFSSNYTINTAHLVAGLNTITFRVTNDPGYGNPTGLRVEFVTKTVSVAQPEVESVPEPASLLLWSGLGIAGFVAARRRKKFAA